MDVDYFLAINASWLIFGTEFPPAIGFRVSFLIVRTDMMDPAGEEFVRSAIAHQGALLGHQASQLSSTNQEVETLTAQVVELSWRFRELQNNDSGLVPDT